MKQACDIEIAVPRRQVVALFDDADSLLKWQPDLIRFEPISGTPGYPAPSHKESSCVSVFRVNDG